MYSNIFCLSNLQNVINVNVNKENFSSNVYVLKISCAKFFLDERSKLNDAKCVSFQKAS